MSKTKLLAKALLRKAGDEKESGPPDAAQRAANPAVLHAEIMRVMRSSPKSVDTDGHPMFGVEYGDDTHKESTRQQDEHDKAAWDDTLGSRERAKHLLAARAYTAAISSGHGKRYNDNEYAIGNRHVDAMRYHDHLASLAEAVGRPDPVEKHSRFSRFYDRKSNEMNRQNRIATDPWSPAGWAIRSLGRTVGKDAREPRKLWGPRPSSKQETR